MCFTPEAESNLAVLIKEPAHLTTYPVTNSGCFAEGLPYSTEANVLGPNEALFKMAIHALLNQQDVVRAVDVGGMLGCSFVRIAREFPQEIAAGTLQMIVMNREPDFTIEAGIAEAKRRINIHNNWNEIVRLFTKTSADRKFLHQLSNNGKDCLLARQEDIEILENYYTLVTYMSGVDTIDLPQAIDLIHERLGGLYHHPDHHNVLSAIARVINPATGSIMTTTPINMKIFHEGFAQLTAMGLRLFGQPPGGYWLYGMPKSPMASPAQGGRD